MSEHPDKLREAFSLLASDAGAVHFPDRQLEARMMTEAAKWKTRSGRRVALIAAGVLAAVSITTVVAAGGVSAIMNWFATVELIHADGTREALEVTPDGVVHGDNIGTAVNLRVTPLEGQSLEGKTIRVFLKDADSDASGGSGAAPAGDIVEASSAADKK